ncbi:MAG: hypothetical protein KTR30_30040 [Saprospiraceae bacterium]|nr:hypothetical protein [Saprospiraceae bacterium]
MIKYTFTLIGCLWLSCSWGQKAQEVNQSFDFKEGVYMSFEDFQLNRPTYTLDIVAGELVTNEEEWTIKAQNMRIKREESETPLDLKDVWGICFNGIPYVKRSLTEGPVTFAIFSGMRLRGKICYYSYEEEETKMITVSAYNPLNGRPFRTGKVATKEWVKREKILHFEGGEAVDFNRENLLKWIADDPQLVSSIEDLGDDLPWETLYKCLRIYLDRHKVYVKM